MVYDNQNHCVVDFVYRPEIKILRNTKFRKLDMFTSAEEGSEKPILLGLLERTNLDHWSTNTWS
jgi:hypothetical protein